MVRRRMKPGVRRRPVAAFGPRAAKRRVIRSGVQSARSSTWSWVSASM